MDLRIKIKAQADLSIQFHNVAVGWLLTLPVPVFYMSSRKSALAKLLRLVEKANYNVLICYIL